MCLLLPWRSGCGAPLWRKSQTSTVLFVSWPLRDNWRCVRGQNPPVRRSWCASGPNAEQNSSGPCGEKLDKEQRTARRLRLSHRGRRCSFFALRLLRNAISLLSHGRAIYAQRATKKGQVADYRSLAISPKFTILQDGDRWSLDKSTTEPNSLTQTPKTVENLSTHFPKREEKEGSEFNTLLLWWDHHSRCAIHSLAKPLEEK